MRPFCFGMLFLLLSCSGTGAEEVLEVPLEAHFLLGSWQLDGTKISIGGPLQEEFNAVQNGPIYTFELNSIFKQTSFDGKVMDEGRFTFTDNELFFTSNGAKEPFSFSVTRDLDSMEWSPTGPYICIEGCLYRYVRME